MRVVLSLGSNIDRDINIRFAVKELKKIFGELIVSPVYLAQAVGFKGPDFYNMVVAFESQLAVDAVLNSIHEVEENAGRKRGAKSYGSRTLDIDILLYGDADLHDQGRNIPRDEIENAAYVLKPLLDILPLGKHPISGRSYASLWEGFDQSHQPLEIVDYKLS